MNFQELTLRNCPKVPEAPEMGPQKAPKGYRSARFGPQTAVKSAIGALLVPLFGQFL